MTEYLHLRVPGPDRLQRAQDALEVKGVRVVEIEIRSVRALLLCVCQTAVVTVLRQHGHARVCKVIHDSLHHAGLARRRAPRYAHDERSAGVAPPLRRVAAPGPRERRQVALLLLRLLPL